MKRHRNKNSLSLAGHVNDELELRIGSMENSMNRLGRILDAIQNDVMHVNKTMKEVLLEGNFNHLTFLQENKKQINQLFFWCWLPVEGIRQKTTIHDSNVQVMVRI